jgi:hypothetical protein
VAANSTPVNVNVNFSGVSYDPNNGWSGQPTWNVNPNPANIPPTKAGDTMTIQWNLNAAAVPRGFTASFAANGIAFGTNWRGASPSSPNSTTISVNDTFNGLVDNQDYEYMVSVILSNGTVTQSFTLDPDVINEAGTANLAIRKSAR